MSRSFLITICLLGGAFPAAAHDAHGRSNAPTEARRIRNPLGPGDRQPEAARPLYEAQCANCHGADGKAATPAAAKLPVRPTNLTEYAMESMRDGEIYWVITNGIEQRMPAFERQIDETRRWQLVIYVRALRDRQAAAERALLGPFRWNLPPGFPFPNVPAANPMTAEKAELGRYLFYDKRLSFNQTQSCASCHQQERAFTDGRAHGRGSTGELHPRGSMSLVNVAYAPILTWANPNVRTLEQQALVPLFGEAPVELGMTGKEDLLLSRLRQEPRYAKLFAAAFPGSADPFTLANTVKAIASFERTILSGDAPFDRYRRGDDPDALSDSAKRGEALFFSERLECFHCHGGFNFTGSIDYLGKGFPEIEFHNTGLYNRKGPATYPAQNNGLYEFTHQEEDSGKFKAPTLRNIALTAPYMHDGSVSTLADAIAHYSAGGRTIKSGPNAGVGADNPNKSEFIKSFQLSSGEKEDLLAFLRCLTDEELIHNEALSDPWAAPAARKRPASRHVVEGVIAALYVEDGAVALYHEAIPGLMAASRAPHPMEFIADPAQLLGLRVGQRVFASVRRQGADYVLQDLRPLKPATKGTGK